jgi:hypothetical protein
MLVVQVLDVEDPTLEDGSVRLSEMPVISSVAGAECNDP